MIEPAMEEERVASVPKEEILLARSTKRFLAEQTTLATAISAVPTLKAHLQLDTLRALVTKLVKILMEMRRWLKNHVSVTTFAMMWTA